MVGEGRGGALEGEKMYPSRLASSHPVDPGRHMEWREYGAGWGSGIVNICLTFPVNKTMFRQQLHGISAWEAFCQLRTEGVLQLYRGILPPLLQKSACTALMFGSYEQYRQLLRVHTDLAGTAALPLAAFLAGCTEAALTPFERTLMLDQHYCQMFRNTP